MPSAPLPSHPTPEDRAHHRLILAEPPPPSGPPWKRRLRGAAKVLAWLTLTGATAALVGSLAVYYVFSEGLPEIPRVSA